ncbi:MAG TPA: 30S ribosome-binding factor RbfA [Thermoanaerobaculia bacterium]|nr:30S ribosome-binding factor RbfA [Thermoanaerobaculia bacterium]
MSRRTDRVSDLLRAELAQLLLRDVHDPRIRLASLIGIAAVEVSPDLRRAVVMVSSLGDDEQRLATVEALRHARGFLRTELAHRLRLRVTPELVFELDRSAEHSQTISDLLESLHGRDESS